uniref:Uncharacterized protein n=1 Tax=Panagrolaimus davidi TaxID=227884 RepID=A0A914Q7L2_9BILA
MDQYRNTNMLNVGNISTEEMSSDEETLQKVYEKEFPDIKVMSHVVVVRPDPNKLKEIQLSEQIKVNDSHVMETKKQQEMVVNLVKSEIGDLQTKLKAIMDCLDKNKHVDEKDVEQLNINVDKVLSGIKAVNAIEQEKVDLQEENFGIREERRKLRDQMNCPRGQ